MNLTEPHLNFAVLYRTFTCYVQPLSPPLPPSPSSLQTPPPSLQLPIPPNLPLKSSHPLPPKSLSPSLLPCSLSSLRIRTTAATNPTLSAKRGSRVLLTKGLAGKGWGREERGGMREREEREGREGKTNREIKY